MLLAAVAAPAAAQVDGHVSLLFDVLSGRRAVPRPLSAVSRAAGARCSPSGAASSASTCALNLAGYVDGLLADRGSRPERRRRRRAAIVGPRDLYVEFVASRFDMRAGASRLVWGRLDEFQPTDVVNPIDSDALPARGAQRGAAAGRHWCAGACSCRASSTIEAVVVPAFRASRFDQLDEDVVAVQPAERRRPPMSRLAGASRRQEPACRPGATLQGGVRLTSTVGPGRLGDLRLSRLPDVSASLTLLPTLAGPPAVVETFPRFTMIGGDFETVRGPWGVRGRDRGVSSTTSCSRRGRTRGVRAQSIEGGVGVDRRAGDYRMAAQRYLVVAGVDTSDRARRSFEGDVSSRDRLRVVVVADRTFARETRTLRLFAVYDPGDATVFARLIAAVSLRDNVWLEGSAGLFAGSALDTIGRLTRRDFVYARLKVFF